MTVVVSLLGINSFLLGHQWQMLPITTIKSPAAEPSTSLKLVTSLYDISVTPPTGNVPSVSQQPKICRFQDGAALQCEGACATVALFSLSESQGTVQGSGHFLVII